MDDIYLNSISETDNEFTKGKLYKAEIVFDDVDCVDCYQVIDNEGDKQNFTIEPDQNGESFKTWFELYLVGIDTDGS